MVSRGESRRACGEQVRRAARARGGAARGGGAALGARTVAGRLPCPWHNPATMQTARSMPFGVKVFLGYAFLILAGIGLSLRWVVDQAINTPISPIGIVWMVLLAYTIFTTTLVLQRKQASYTLALGLASLTIPAIPLLVLAALWPYAIPVAILSIVLLRSLTRPGVRDWLDEQ